MGMQSNTSTRKQKGMSYRSRLVARLGFIAACVLLLCPGIPFLYILFIPARKTGNFWDDIFPVILTLGIIGGALFAIIKLRTVWHAPINFVPSYHPIPPEKPGNHFEVWYQETNLGSPFGRGTMEFAERDLTLEGHLFTGSLYSLLSSRLGEKTSTKIQYSDIASVSIKGRYIALGVDIGLPIRSSISFYVSQMDEERMYKELNRHLPALVENQEKINGNRILR